MCVCVFLLFCWLTVAVPLKIRAKERHVLSPVKRDKRVNSHVPALLGLELISSGAGYDKFFKWVFPGIICAFRIEYASSCLSPASIPFPATYQGLPFRCGRWMGRQVFKTCWVPLEEKPPKTVDRMFSVAASTRGVLHVFLHLLVHFHAL